MVFPGPTAAAKPGEILERWLVAAAGAVAASLVVMCGGVLAIRRLGGGFDPTGAACLVVAALGGLTVLAVDAAARAAQLPAAWRWASRAGYLFAVAALGIPPRFAAGLDAALFIAAAGLAGAVIVGPVAGVGVGRWAGRIRARRMPFAPGLSAVKPLPPALEPAAACPGRLLQRVERYEADGIDHVHGTLLLTVPEGSRSAHGHLGFCPAFRTVPRVEAGTAYDGVEAIVTAAEILPWGVRIECRLDEPAEEPVEIPVDIHAQSPA